MLIRNNAGEVIGEMNTIFTQEGSVVRTDTSYSSGCPIVQNVMVVPKQRDKIAASCPPFVAGAILSLSFQKRGPDPCNRPR